jgi:hypothetical protein
VEIIGIEEWGQDNSSDLEARKISQIQKFRSIQDFGFLNPQYGLQKTFPDLKI